MVRFFLICILTGFFIPISIMADTDSIIENDSLDDIAKLRAEIEILRIESERLKAEKIKLSSNKDIDVSSDPIKYTKSKRKPTKRDTIQLITKEGAKSFLASFTGKKRSSRERGYGGGIGPAMSLNSINLSPVKKLISVAPETKGIDFPIDGKYESFMMIGGLFYGGIGNGIRVGGGGWGGSKWYSQNNFEDTSNISVDINIGYGGFLLEKCHIVNKMNIVWGGIIGAGAIATDVIYSSNKNGWEIIKNQPTQYTEYTATFMLMELHGGFTATTTSWLHVGLDLTMPLFLAPMGFQNETGFNTTSGFVTFNPGIRIRIILGNLG